MINKRADIWDKKAHRYPKYDKKESQKARRLIERFEARGVRFLGKRVLDIGCGTGRNSIEIAKSAKSVDALDISQNMLSHLESAAKSEDIANIRTINLPFLEFEADKKYDVVVATMTPALQTREEFLKALSLVGRSFAYVGWGRKRSAPLLEEAFLMHSAKLHLPFGAPGAIEFLEELGVRAEVEYESEVWEHEVSVDDAIDEICWHLEIGGVSADRDGVERLVKSRFSGVVKQSHEVETGMIVCHF